MAAHELNIMRQMRTYWANEGFCIARETRASWTGLDWTGLTGKRQTQKGASSEQTPEVSTRGGLYYEIRNGKAKRNRGGRGMGVPVTKEQKCFPMACFLVLSDSHTALLEAIQGSCLRRKRSGAASFSCPYRRTNYSFTCSTSNTILDVLGLGHKDMSTRFI